MTELKELMLRPARRTLAVAESLTCGRVQARIGSISGASEFFLGGITAYTLDQKVKHFGVKRAAAKRVNCVSSAVAKQMAAGVCRLFGSELGLATTGYAEPAAAAPHPFAFWALAHVSGRKTIFRSGRVDCPGATRVQVQEEVAETVIAELVKYLRELRR